MNVLKKETNNGTQTDGSAVVFCFEVDSPLFCMFFSFIFHFIERLVCIPCAVLGVPMLGLVQVDCLKNSTSLKCNAMQCYNCICSIQRPHYIMHIATSAQCTPKLSITKSQNWNEFVYFTNFEPLFVYISQQVMLLQLFYLSVQRVSLMLQLVNRKRRQRKNRS